MSSAREVEHLSDKLMVTVRISRFASLTCYHRQSSHQNVIYEAFPERGWVDYSESDSSSSFSAQIFAVLAIPCHSVGYNASPLGPQLFPGSYSQGPNGSSRINHTRCVCLLGGS